MGFAYHQVLIQIISVKHFLTPTKYGEFGITAHQGVGN